MPFSKTENIPKEQWLKIYENLFKPIIEDSKFGYTCVKSESNTGSFTKEIIHNLKNAKTVLADISDFNHNVMWELGVRHALSKRTIMVAREDMIDKIPSDITNYVVIPYSEGNTEYKEFKEKIHNIFQKIDADPDRADSPVFDYLSVEELVLSSQDRNKIISNLNGLLSELLFDLNFAEHIESGEADVGLKTTTLGIFTVNAMDYLLSTNYVTASKLFYLTILVVRNRVREINRRLDMILLDKRVHQDRSHSENIKTDIVDIIADIKDGIKETTQLRKNIRKGMPEFIEPPTIVFDDKHEKLLE